MDTEGSRQAQPESSSSASLVDTASTLRAAALLSRKRRKVATETLSRRAPEPSLRLDYGHEGSMSPSGHVSPVGTRHISHPQSGPSISTSTTKKTPDTEDGQREEGEISDTETSPTPAPPPQQRTRTPTPPARISPRASTTQPLQHYHRQGATKTETLPPSQTPSLRDSDTVSPSEPGPSWRDGNYLPNEPFVLETPTYRLDPHHVRPGLTMTQQEYDTAKDVVLDLLGWGVPPEYLVEHGISRYIIYYVFTELNLRLPDNLDVSDLVPYPTPEMLEKLTISPSPTTWSFRSSSASAMPPPPVIPIRDSLADVADRADILMSSSPSRSPTVKAEPSSPSPTDLSLHAIEQQRRQELLARKAAIASQRARQSDREVAIQPGGTLGLAAVPSQSVDDFLKTIEPNHADSSNEGDRKSVNPSLEMKSDESMDVDEPVLGPISVTEDDSRLSTSPQTVPSKMTDPTAQTELNLPAVVPPGSSSDALRSTASRHGLSSLTLSADAAGDPPTLRQQLSADDSDGTNSHHRRGSKRPVAADFVDFDTSLARNQGGSYSNGYANGGSQLIRRKTGSFASINMRRCVIELSDSEDDGDGRLLAPTPNANGREYSPAVVAVPTHYSSRLRTTTTPPIPASSGGAQSTGLTAPPPSALLEKEEEIKKMRQLIAEREEMRLRKLAVVRGPACFCAVRVLRDDVDVRQVNAGRSTGECKCTTRSIEARRYLVDFASLGSGVSATYFQCNDFSGFVYIRLFQMLHFKRGFHFRVSVGIQHFYRPIILSSWSLADSVVGTSDTVVTVESVKSDPTASSETSTIGSLFRFSAGPTVD
ncbi:hypothetical protein BKA83DRAFT_14431 [Pisolithus microcarpus]|nr:hypothetical protein BKA83DRAFT_14431 [Pisolithus microcarpus]